MARPDARLTAKRRAARREAVGQATRKATNKIRGIGGAISRFEREGQYCAMPLRPLVAPAPERPRIVLWRRPPHQLNCAMFNGCRAIAVATGGATLDALEATDADLVVETLADYAAIERWIVAAAG